MIAIATPNPDTPAETFVRQHIRLIAPGSTAVVLFEGEGKAVKALPTFRVKRGERWPFPLSKLAGVLRLFAHGYAGAVTGGEMERLARFLRENKVQAVLAEFGPTGCALRKVCRETGIRLIVNFHGHDATVMPRRWATRYAYKHLAREADRFVCGSHHFAGVLRGIGIPGDKVEVVPCGIELEDFDAEGPKDSNLVVTVGRFVDKKAPHLSLEAFAKATAGHPEARLEMIGDGPLRTRCQELAGKLGVSDRVVFHGARDHQFVKDLLARAGLFLQHSLTAPNGDTESQGISLLEAMASGVPVVTTDHNGFSETVVEGETGFLVPERDVDAMAGRIAELRRDEALRARMGKRGRERVREQFAAPDLAARLRKVLGVSMPEPAGAGVG